MKYIFALLLTLVSAGSAFADMRDSTTFTVPFDFVIGNATFPAGKYSISRVSVDPSAGLMIRSDDARTTAVFFPTTSQESNPDGNVKVQFRQEGARYYLIGVVGELDTYTIHPRPNYHNAPRPSEMATATP